VPSATHVPCIERNRSKILGMRAFVTSCFILHFSVYFYQLHYDICGVFIYTSVAFTIFVMES
jgi:hypothetical protein